MNDEPEIGLTALQGELYYARKSLAKTKKRGERIALVVRIGEIEKELSIGYRQCRAAFPHRSD